LRSACSVASSRGVTLVEILLVVAVLAVMAVGAMTLLQPGLTDELENAAQIVLADVERARNLAVANNSKYKLTFISDGSGYYLQHSGSNASLNTLPSWPYRQRTDPADRQTTLLRILPGLGDVDILGAAVQVASGVRSQVTDLEFTSLGATTRVQTTEIWLAAGRDSSRRYLAVAINPTTGLATIGELAGTAHQGFGS
jgi:prepilin-type N-terminal cleavage/methylation domain-containing protein